MADEQTQQTTQQTPEQERAELTKFREDLLKVHETLKGQADLLTALQGYGITNVNELATKMQSGTQQTQQQTDVENQADEISQGSGEGDNDRLTKLEGENEYLRDQVSQMNIAMRTDRLQNQIMNEIKGKPEYSLLEKAMDSNIANRIMYQMHQDQQQGKQFDLTHYLQDSEKNLKAFYQKLGGQLPATTPAPGQQQPGQDGAQVSQMPSDANKGTIPTMPTPPQGGDSAQKKTVGGVTFPSLPSAGGDGQTASKNSYKNYLEKGRNPLTGKVDEDIAFEKNLQTWVATDPTAQGGTGG